MDIITKAKLLYGIKSRKLLKAFTEGYIGKKIYEYELNDGTKKICEQITKRNGNGDAVVIIPILDTGKFLLIVESRPNTDEEIIVEFPAGMIDENETSKDAALRELREETGLDPQKIYELEWHYQDQGCSKAKISTFVAENCTYKYNQELDEGEKILTLEVTLNELIELLNNNTIVDANSKIAGMAYQLKRKG